LNIGPGDAAFIYLELPYTAVMGAVALAVVFYRDSMVVNLLAMSEGML
jgi:hypothetical protein